MNAKKDWTCTDCKSNECGIAGSGLGLFGMSNLPYQSYGYGFDCNCGDFGLAASCNGCWAQTGRLEQLKKDIVDDKKTGVTGDEGSESDSDEGSESDSDEESDLTEEDEDDTETDEIDVDQATLA